MDVMSFVAGSCLGATVACLGTLVIVGKAEAAERAMRRQALERAGDCPKCAERLPIIAALQRLGLDFHVHSVSWTGSAGDLSPIDAVNDAVRQAHGLPKV